MDNFNLDNVWKDSDDQADEYYNIIKPKILDMARKNSHSILDKLKRTIIAEWIGSTLFLSILLLFLSDSPRFYLLLIVSAIGMIGMVIPYQKLFKKLKAIPTQNVRTSIESYIEILDGFIKQMKWLSYIATPIGFFLGLYIYTSKTPMEFHVVPFSMFLIICVIMFVLVHLFIVKWYIPKLYGEPKREFEELLQSLDSAE